MTAGLTTLENFLKPGVFEQTAHQTAALTKGMIEIAASLSIPLQAASQGTMFGFYFLHEQGQKITSYAEAKRFAHTKRYAQFFHAMLAQGVYLACSQFEAGFVSATHTTEIIQQTLTAAQRAMEIGA
jgi:glutamate-1-semialdehyde 2,1-aminomutase